MLPAVLSHRDFRIYVAGNFFALNGVWIQRITIAWLAWELTQSAAFVGATAFLMMLPTLLLGPLLGVVADRVDVRLASQGVQAGLMAATALLTLAYFTGLLGPVLLAALALLIGLVTAFHHPLRMALAPRLVPRDEIGAAVPIISINFNMTRFLGPFIAGLLIAWQGVGAALLVNLAAFAPMLAALHVVRPRAKASPTRAAEGFLASLRAGVAHARGDALILGGILVTALTSLSARGVQDILPVIADGAFARGPAGLGQMTAAAGFGALVSSAWLVRFPIRAEDGLPRSAILGGGIALALVAVLGFAPTWWAALACVAALGAAGTQVGVGIQSAIQIRLDDDMRGRVMSLWTTTAIGGTALGALILGAAADAVGLRPALVTASLLSLAALALVLARYRAALRASASRRSRKRERSALENGLPPP